MKFCRFKVLKFCRFKVLSFSSWSFCSLAFSRLVGVLFSSSGSLSLAASVLHLCTVFYAGVSSLCGA